MNRREPATSESDAHTGNRLILTKTDELKEIPMEWRVYGNLQIKKRNSGVERWVKEMVGEIKAKCNESPWKTSEVLKGYIALHDRFSMEKGIPSSCEVLTDLILKNGSVPHINTFVDIYNVISVLTGVSIGAHDTRNISGNARLLKIKKDTAFKPIGGRGEGMAKRGEFAYVDDAGVMCRMDVKQCNRTKITDKTRNVLVIFQGHAGIGENALHDSILLLEEALRQFQILE
jgi:DNA/RNA-binding domain of Phe-tRNA-synthetase-like protein